MNQKIDTVIIGGGQAGLSASYYLTQVKREHLILEQSDQAAHAWRNDRWDSFTLLTPNWSWKLPGAEYQGEQPDVYAERAEIIERFEQYIQRFHLPVQYNTRVIEVSAAPDGRGLLVKTQEAVFEARNVVVATGLYQGPKLPAWSKDLPKNITQLHSGHYRNPTLLPPGAVLVAGSGQSGCQIAEELYQSGRQVYLITGSAGRVPRRYRGKDIYEWMYRIGFFDRTPDKLPSPKARFSANPHVSGRNGGHTLNLHQFARDGVRLLGRLQGGGGKTIYLAPDLHENLARADKFEADMIRNVDNAIAQAGLDAPAEALPALTDGFAQESVTELDLSAAGITSIIWALGYAFDFSLVKFPIFDSDGYPIQARGVTQVPGLYFLGLPWLFKQKSGLLVGVGEDAEYITSHIAAQK